MRAATARTCDKYTDSAAPAMRAIKYWRPRIIAPLNASDTQPAPAAPLPAAAVVALPSLLPAIAAPGRKSSAGPFAGSSDALALAQSRASCASASASEEPTNGPAAILRPGSGIA